MAGSSPSLPDGSNLRCYSAVGFRRSVLAVSENDKGLAGTSTQNRLLKLAREGGQMTPKDLGKLEPQRRYCDPGRRGAGEHRDRDR